MSPPPNSLPPFLSHPVCLDGGGVVILYERLANWNGLPVPVPRFGTEKGSCERDSSRITNMGPSKKGFVEGRWEWVHRGFLGHLAAPSISDHNLCGRPHCLRCCWRPILAQGYHPSLACACACEGACWCMGGPDGCQVAVVVQGP